MVTKTEKQKPASHDNYPLSLDEFCARLSKTDRRVELIGGFHLAMRERGMLRDTDSAYRRAFAEFLRRPA